jgi:hypothetical protein
MPPIELLEAGDLFAVFTDQSASAPPFREAEFASFVSASRRTLSLGKTLLDLRSTRQRLENLLATVGVAVMPSSLTSGTLADDRRIDAIGLRGQAHIFALPGSVTRLRIVSRAAAPAELGLARDPRMLGVAFRSIVVRQGSWFRVTGAADACLIDGYHGYESAPDLRWTNGDATVPLSSLAAVAGPS